KRALAPSSAARSLPCLSLKSAMTTLPPASTSMRAVAAPNPDAPPVTMNVLPSIRISPFLSIPGRRLSRLRLEHRHRGGDQAREIREVRRHDHRVVGLRDVRERANVLLGDLEV